MRIFTVTNYYLAYSTSDLLENQSQVLFFDHIRNELVFFLGLSVRCSYLNEQFYFCLVYFLQHLTLMIN